MRRRREREREQHLMKIFRLCLIFIVQGKSVQHVRPLIVEETFSFSSSSRISMKNNRCVCVSDVLHFVRERERET